MTEDDDEWTPEAEAALSTLGVLAQFGHAPLYRCSAFAVGNEKRIARLRKRYLAPPAGSMHRSGDSVEKFVVGEFGSGKTHFLSQLLETAKELGYATSLVKLDINADILSPNFILSRVAGEMVAPDGREKGLDELLSSLLDRMKEDARAMGGGEEQASALLSRRLAELRKRRFEQNLFGKVATDAFAALLAGDQERFRDAARWLSGEISDARIAKVLGVSRYPANLVEPESRRLLLSLYQLVRECGYSGTVVAFDETDQNWRKITPKHKGLFYSLLQSEVNALVDTKDLAVMIAYSLVPEIYDHMNQYPALQNRIVPPSPKLTFEKGNTDCPVIMISRPPDLSVEEIREELVSMGDKLIDMLYRIPGEHRQCPRDMLEEAVEEIAQGVVEEDLSSGDRRTMVKRTASVLNRYYYDGVLPDPDDLKDLKDLDEGPEEE